MDKGAGVIFPVIDNRREDRFSFRYTDCIRDATEDGTRRCDSQVKVSRYCCAPHYSPKTCLFIEGNYGRLNPAREYLYLRISQKEPFDILYFTPSITWISNISDNSFSLSPELLYTGITNLELRLKAGIIAGERLSEYGEKQNDYRVEMRARYYF